MLLRNQENANVMANIMLNSDELKLGGILSTLIATVVVHKFGLEIHNGWRVALGLAALSQFCAVVFYLLFASGEEQPWAYADSNLKSENVIASRDRVELLEANI
ncbi:hypothetical protein X801_02542 [Opisthorchis viverrini]|uniref:Uncharacterized protein n=1 Tax=Opisthorchis viverrini TaxID=6198 RepID=A0A1S8X4B4_OPIVI|nr:hypothetical protein X801_02542 [Opisthorchis viverrini]